MVAVLARQGRELAKRLLLIQLSAVMVAAAVFAVAVNGDWGLSALVGGGILSLLTLFCGLCFPVCRGARVKNGRHLVLYG